MTNTGNIENTYGNAMNVAIANTYAKNVLEASYLPKSSIIISTEYDTEDIGHAAMLVTDNNGNAAKVSNYIIEGNGLHVDQLNTNVVSMKIDNKTIHETSNGLSIDIANFIDNSSLVGNGDQMQIDSQALTKASDKSFGVAKVDNRSVKSDNGTLYVDTENLDYAGKNSAGIVKGDETTVNIRDGVVSVNTQNLQKSSNLSHGVSKVDNQYIISDNGTISIDKSKLRNINVDGKKMHKADNITIENNNGTILLNTNNLQKATDINAGVAKIDPNSLEIGDNNILHVKNLDNMFTYVYDYEEGMDEIESRISSMRTMLDSGNFVYAEPEIRHLTCNQTTTAILEKPEYLEEPINMETQHVYVSLSAITNCRFVVEVIYDNNVVPNVELESINYNDEFKVSGVECLEYIWPSTGMKEKNIVLLFNSKNFFSTTGPKTDVTKLSIALTAYDDNTKTKRVIYSIIRYNSFYKEDDDTNEPEQQFVEYSAEYVVDEKNSKWFIVKLQPDDDNGFDTLEYWDENISTFNPEASYVLRKGSIGAKDVESTITVDEIQGIFDSNADGVERRALYLNGVYIHRESGKSYSFMKKIPVEYFDTNTQGTNGIDSLKGRGVYDYPYKVDFDTLYFQIRYQVDNSTKIIILNNDIKEYAYHGDSIEIDAYLRNESNYPVCFTTESGGITTWSTCASKKIDFDTQIQSQDREIRYIENIYLVLNNAHKILKACANESDDRIIEFKDENGVYAYFDITDVENVMQRDENYTINYSRLILKHNFDSLNIYGKIFLYFITPIMHFDLILENNYSDALAKLDGVNDAKSATIFSFGLVKYNYDARISFSVENNNDYAIYNKYNPKIDYTASILYQNANDENAPFNVITNNSEDISYKMIDLYVEGNKINDNTFTPKTVTYIDAGQVMFDYSEYTVSVSYNFAYGENNSKNYWETAKTQSLTIPVYSDPKIVMTGLNIDLSNRHINLQKYDDINIAVNNVKSIGVVNRNVAVVNESPIDCFASYIMFSYEFGDYVETLDSQITLSQYNAIDIPDVYSNNSYELHVITLEQDDISETWNYDSNIYNLENISEMQIQYENPSKYVFAYVLKVGNDFCHSNVISTVNYRGDAPQISLEYSPYVFIDDETTTIYSYATVNNLPNYYTCNVGESYFRTGTYAKLYTDSIIQYTCSYDESIHYQTTNNISSIDDLVFNVSGTNFANDNETYLGYVNDGKAFFRIGDVLINRNIDLNDYISSYVCVIKEDTNTHEIIDNSKYKLTIAQNGPEIFGFTNDLQYIENIAQMTLVTETSPFSGIVFNSYFTNMTFVHNANNGKIFSTTGVQQYQLFELTNIYSYMLDNTYNIPLAGDNYYSILYKDNENYALINTAETNDHGNFTIGSGSDEGFLSADHYIYEARYKGETISYSYNIPNLFGFYDSYCSIEKYNGFYIPKCEKMYDEYFTPYDFEVIAINSNENGNCLNKKITSSPTFEFKMKYKGVELASSVTKTILSDTTTNVECQLAKTYQDENNNVRAYCYFYKSLTSAYSYVPVQMYIDNSLVSFTETNIESGISYIALNNINDTVTLLGENKVYYGNVYTYLLNPNDMLWNLINYNENASVQNASTYEFNLAKFDTYEYIIRPDLVPNYGMITYDIGNFFYDLEDSTETNSSSF